VQARPQQFRFGENLGKNLENPVKIRRNFGKICEKLRKPLKILANSLKIRAKMEPNVL